MIANVTIGIRKKTPPSRVVFRNPAIDFISFLSA
jgi:hypothetical protein